MSREPHVVVSRVGTLASYLWVPSKPMIREAARDLAAQQERKGIKAVVHTERHVRDFGLPEGWEGGRTDAQCIRERLLDIESEMEAESEAHNESESTEEWPTVRFQHLDNELQALRRRLAKIHPRTIASGRPHEEQPAGRSDQGELRRSRSRQLRRGRSPRQVA